ncbi:ferredoxin [Saccharothrix coeruleofusca]|uniref:Ferredoxin n=1 Tax=Saccharothrix coeruleofusca TaxID=33919 RepID=A0A918EDX9_9PSEU|nr:ferredoxin [Saccharothrix coeruleofusca]MBP2336615.1 ferredoxin [Saccharothrix coeruleofusca]GGP51726.1 ferredoxin [Saccharothrix coeruleofusca]GGP85059.1 ferredoxin [Saccharothrix coeruleofusca]
MRVRVDVNRCVASGQCVVAAAGAFTQSEQEGTVVLLVAEPPPELRAAVREAASLCPSGAITVKG